MGDAGRNSSNGGKQLGDRVSLPTEWVISDRVHADLELLLSGGMRPLTGFMDSMDYYSVLQNMRLTSGEVWPMPIVFPVRKDCGVSNLHWEVAGEAQDEVVIGIRDGCGTLLGELVVSDVYEPDLELEKKCILGTTDTNHPYVRYLDQEYSDCYYVGGSIRVKAGIKHYDFADCRKAAYDCRTELTEKYKYIVGFQTRNPMHRSHCELTKMAMREVMSPSNDPERITPCHRKNMASVVDPSECCLLITPAIGPTQKGDIDFPIRVHCYRKVLPYYTEGYDVAVVLLPIAMRMAGPREALWHALIRKNYGCTHFIIGRDHAGPSAKTQEGKSFYEPYAAHQMLKSVSEEIGIVPIFGKSMKYVSDGHDCYMEENQIPLNVTSHDISGTKFREMLINREEIPPWYTYPEVVQELQKFYKPKHMSGFVMYFTGLPCSGKSTLAQAMQATLIQNDNEQRRITLLDADIVRAHLSKGLGFTKADRSTNVQRIGYVAAEIAKHGGICLVANIAPYSKDRSANRELVENSGGTYIQIFVNTPLSVCEKRDPKGLYKQARQGLIKHFTGISDPYQTPTGSEIEADCSNSVEENIAGIMGYLNKEGYIQSTQTFETTPEPFHLRVDPSTV